MSDSPAVVGADTIHVVQAGDSLSTIALKYYGDAARYPEIAERNDINPQAVLFIGRRLIVPAARRSEENALPTSPGGSTPVAYGNDIIETVTTVAKRIPPFWADWRFWLAIGGAAAVLWFFNSQRGRR